MNKITECSYYIAKGGVYHFTVFRHLFDLMSEKPSVIIIWVKKVSCVCWFMKGASKRKVEAILVVFWMKKTLHGLADV